MIDIFRLYEDFLSRVNTHINGHAQPVRKFQGWVNQVRLELFEDYYKAYEKSYHISDNLTPFLRSRNVLITPNPGTMWDLIKKPKDYERWGSMRVYRRGETVCALKGCETVDCDGGYVDPDKAALLQVSLDDNLKEFPVHKVETARWSAISKRVGSKGATFNEPKTTQFEEGFKIAPKGLGVVVFDYFRLPQEAKFNYQILNAGTEQETIEYMPAGSQHLEFPASMIPEFLAALEVHYAAFKGNAFLTQKGMADKVDVK